MDYSFYSGAPSQQFPLYGLHGLPTPDQNQAHRSSEDAFSSLNNYNHHNHNPNHSQDFQSFDPSFRFNPGTSFVPPPHSPPDSFSKHSVSSSDAPNQQGDHMPADGMDDQPLGRSDSEEKEGIVTPAQSKRKAQNRAAQRAFRERKERHVKELEQKVSKLEQDSSRLQADNERLKQQLAKFSTENEILRATSKSFTDANHHHSNNNNNQNHHRSAEPEQLSTTTGPMKFTPTDFYATLVPNGEPRPVHRITVCEKTGEKLFDAGATWDLIQNHELFKRGLVDIGDVTERLKGVTRCNGQGPVFGERDIRTIIEESAANGTDELI